MAAQADRIQVNYDGSPYTLTRKENEKAGDSTVAKIGAYLSTANGGYQTTKWFGKVFGLGAEAAVLAGKSEKEVKPLKDVAKVFNTAAGGMIFAYWGWASTQLVEQISTVANKGVGEGRFVELIRVSADWVTAGCHSVSSFLPVIKSTLGDIASCTDLSADSIESYQAIEKLSKANILLSENVNLSDQVKGDLESNTTLQWIAIAKSAVAVTAGIFAVLGLILGAVFLPPIVSLTMAFVGCTLSIAKSFYQENMVAKPLSKWGFSAVTV
jgi:hypothetical protein